MPVSDEIREQRSKIKTMGWKGKLKYFWDYYKVHTFVAIILVIVVSTLAYEIITDKDYAFYAVLMNAGPSDADTALETEYEEYAEIDTDKYDTFIDITSRLSLDNMLEYDMATIQKMMAMAQVGDFDVLMADPQVFEYYAGNEFFRDIRELLTEQELETYEDRIYYVDAADFDIDPGVESPQYDENGVYIEPERKVVDHKNPASMQKPVPVGIEADGSPLLERYGLYTQTQPVIGFITTGKRPDASVKFFRWLWE